MCHCNSDNTQVYYVANRATNMNEQSSRSHAIFIITVECSQVFISAPSFSNLFRFGGLVLSIVSIVLCCMFKVQYYCP